MPVGIYKRTARDVMTKDLVTVRCDEHVHDALQLMADNHVSTLPVVDGTGKCLGIVSQSDIIDLTRDADAADENQGESNPLSLLFRGVQLDEITNERISDVMSESIVSAQPTDLITAVADKMIAERIHHIPVCNPDGTLIGLVSSMDILAALREPVVV
ncbi:MAG: CBS domain-containing protein [Planctomycetales bacterium]|nr:CBS domain-containing protein [Planctomycetales bacterium]